MATTHIQDTEEKVNESFPVLSSENTDSGALKAVMDTEMDAAVKESDKVYDDIVAQNKATEQSMLDKINDNAKMQEDNANRNTEFAIAQINQQEAQAKNDYAKEQSGAYVDYQKQINRYGTDAELKAAAGLTDTGYSESSKVSIYNQYQRRITAARESYKLAVQTYNNAITQARLQNSSALAEIAAEAFAKSLEISLTFAQRNNTPLTEKAEKRATIEQDFYSGYLDILNQINNTAPNINKESDNGTDKKASQSKARNSIRESIGNVTQSSTENSSSASEREPIPNMQSITSLGYGPISPSKLNSLISSGKVIEYERDGQLYYIRVEP